MVIVLQLVMSVKQYLQAYGSKSPAEAQGCPRCGRRLRRHGRYWRSVVYDQGRERVPIYRYLCPPCRETFSLLPAFLRPYSHFAFEVREAAARMLAAGEKVAVVAEQLCQDHQAGGISGRTLCRWLQGWRQRAQPLSTSVIERILHLVPGFDVTPYLPATQRPRGWLGSVITLGEVLRSLVGGMEALPLFVFLHLAYPVALSL